MSLTLASGRARRGVSGALYPKSAIAGLNSRPRPDVSWDCLRRVVLKIGPCAAESYEPREVRKEAAVSSRFWVPQDLLVRAVRQRKAIRQGRSLVHDPDSVFGREPLPEPAELPAIKAKRLLAQFGLRAKKGLGQHFLVDARVLKRIVAAADLTFQDTVIEVGPGLGILTQELALRAGRVVAIEADAEMVATLGELMARSPNLTVIHSDIMHIDPVSLLDSVGDIPAGYKVIANIPYYITSAVLRHFLEASRQPTLLVVMVQKEVGQTIMAQPGNMSLLTISIQFYGRPSIVAQIPARSFYPPPKVDSVILRIDVYDKPPVDVPSVQAFFDTVRAGFSAPRKQLRNSLAQGLVIGAQEAADLLLRAEVDPRRRAETLSIQEWGRLCRERYHLES